jgi:hypothetical protein
MNISAPVGAMVNFLESVDIQLALEGNEFCLLEVLGQYCLCESSRLQNLEGLSSRLPADQILKSLLLSLLEQSMKLARKRTKLSFLGGFGRHLEDSVML